MKQHYLDLNFEYKDNGYIRQTEFIFTRLETCIMCREDKGRGFKVNNTNPMNAVLPQSIRGEVIGFVCLDCMPNLLNELGYNLEEKEELGFFDLSLPKKYAQFYTRYKQGKVAEQYLQEQAAEFSKFMYSRFIEAIEYVSDLDVEYGSNLTKGTEWRGWWLGASGEDTTIFFSWLNAAIRYNYDNIEKEFRDQQGDRRLVPISVRAANEIFQNFKGKFKKVRHN